MSSMTSTFIALVTSDIRCLFKSDVHCPQWQWRSLPSLRATIVTFTDIDIHCPQWQGHLLASLRVIFNALTENDIHCPQWQAIALVDIDSHCPHWERHSLPSMTFIAGKSPSQPLKPILSWKTVNAKMPWSILFLLGGGYSLAEASKVGLFIIHPSSYWNNLNIYYWIAKW